MKLDDLSKLKDVLSSVWNYKENIINGIFGPGSQVFKALDNLVGKDIKGDDIKIPEDDWPYQGNDNLDSDEGKEQKNYVGTIWEKLIVEISEYLDSIKSSTTNNTESEIVSYICNNFSLNRQLSEIIYSGISKGNILISKSGVVVTDVALHRYIYTMYERMRELYAKFPSYITNEERIKLLSREINLGVGIIESILDDSLFIISSKTTSLSIFQMKRFLLNDELHVMWTKDNQRDIWNRSLIAGKSTIILVNLNGIKQYINYTPQVVMDKTLLNYLDNISKWFKEILQIKLTYWIPLTWEQMTLLAIKLLDYDDNLNKILAKLALDLSKD